MQGRKGERLFGREMNGPGRSVIALDAGCEGCGFTIIVHVIVAVVQPLVPGPGL
jgi:hypothetical protein